jgi:hypothetical protein
MQGQRTEGESSPIVEAERREWDQVVRGIEALVRDRDRLAERCTQLEGSAGEPEPSRRRGWLPFRKGGADDRGTASSQGGDSERELAEARDQLRAATERADRLEAEARAAHAQLDLLQRDLSLGHLYDESRPPAPSNDELAAARRRIDELTQQLRAAHNERESFRSLLQSLGVRPA